MGTTECTEVLTAVCQVPGRMHEGISYLVYIYTFFFSTYRALVRFGSVQ